MGYCFLAVFLLLLVAGSAAIVARVFFVELYRVPSDAMTPTLEVGEQVWFSKTAYGSRGVDGSRVRPGDVVAYHSDVMNRVFVTRVIAIEGQRVQAAWNGTLDINGARVARCSLGVQEIAVAGIPQRVDVFLQRLGATEFLSLQSRDERGDPPSRSFCVNEPCVVPRGHFFAMGDHRDNSYDSRYMGFVRYGSILGRATSVWRSNDARRGGREVHAAPVLTADERAAAARCARPSQ